MLFPTPTLNPKRSKNENTVHFNSFIEDSSILEKSIEAMQTGREFKSKILDKNKFCFENECFYQYFSVVDAQKHRKIIH